jgi:PAS domain S-box-containing protein
LLPIKLLRVEDDPIDCLAFIQWVKQAKLPYDCTVARSLTEALNILSKEKFEIAILDYNLGDGKASDLFAILSAQNCPFVICTDRGDEVTAARLMNQGAADYLIKDPEHHYLHLLPATVTKTLDWYQAQENLEQVVAERTAQLQQTIAARAAAELQRKIANDALHQLNQDLEARVAQWTIELQSREAQLRDLFDNATDLIQSVNQDGRILFVNVAWKDTLGYEDADLAQLSIFQIIHPDDLEHCQTAMTRLFAGEPCLGIETRFLTKDGREIIVEGNVNCQMQDGQPVATRGIFRNITERKQAENALRESQQFLQTVLDAFPMAVFWKDRDSVMLGCNQLFAQLSGFESPLAAIGKTNFDFGYTEAEALSYLADDHQVMESGTGKLGIEETITLSTGEQQWVETNKIPLRGLAGNTVGIVVTFQDISDRKRAEAALAASEAFNRQLVEEFPVGLASCRMDGQLVYVNSAFAKILGRTVEETLSLTYWDITPIEYAEQEAEQLQFLQQHKRYGPYEKEYLHRDGHLVPVLLTGLIIVQNGEKFIWSSVQDISERKQAEQEKIQRVEQETLLREITGRIRQSLDLQTIFDTACQEIRQVLQADRVGIFKFYFESGYNEGRFVAESVVEGFSSVLEFNVYDHCLGENYSTIYIQGRYQVINNI